MGQHTVSATCNRNRLSDEEAEYIESQLSKYYTENEDGCWEWRGYRQRGGPPALVIRHQGRRLSVMVKRFVYIRNNPNESIGTQVQLYNTCGNPDCVNPRHLQQGVGIGSSKFEAMKLVLRAWYPLHLDNIPTQDIAKQVGVCYTTLKTYIAVFNKAPEAWVRLWNK